MVLKTGPDRPVQPGTGALSGPVLWKNRKFRKIGQKPETGGSIIRTANRISWTGFGPVLPPLPYAACPFYLTPVSLSRWWLTFTLTHASNSHCFPLPTHRSPSWSCSLHLTHCLDLSFSVSVSHSHSHSHSNSNGDSQSHLRRLSLSLSNKASIKAITTIRMK